MSISVVINTYNAEATLRDTLESVNAFDEIVVCDMESTDNTLNIAAEFGCKIVTFPKGNNKSAEPARTFAIQSASSEWVFVVDADEMVPFELRDYLYNYIKSKNCANGLFVPRKNFIINHFISCRYPDYQLRFFRREGTIWPPYVHTRPNVKGKIEKISAKKKELALIHKSDSISGYISKLNEYSDNEVEKRKNENVNFLKLIYAPLFRFFKTFVLKGGFLDGKYGLIYAKEEASYKFFALCKMIENRENKIHKK